MSSPALVNGSEMEVLGILYVRYKARLGPMLGDSAFTETLFARTVQTVKSKSPWLECSFSVRRVAESGPEYRRISFDNNFVPTLTFTGHLP